MKKQSTFLSAALMVFAITLTAFFMAGCGGDDSGDKAPPGITAPKVGDLPAFPATANPAETEEAADSVLAELKQSGLFRDVYNRMQEVVWDYRSNNDDYSADYNFTDLEDYYKTVKVSASGKRSEKISKNFEIFNSTEDASVQFTPSDYARGSSESKMKGKVTGDITYSNVTIAAGSTIEQQDSGNEDISVTKADSAMEAKCKISISSKLQWTSGFTVATSAGSVKIILDLTNAVNFSASNISLFDLFNTGDPTKYSGSLKVYGQDNKLLKTVPVTNQATYYQALRLIGYYDDDDYDD